MEIEFDAAKNAKNIRERGISFELATAFKIDTAMIAEDCRYAYDELRFNALGFIADRLYHLTFTMRGDVVRVISLRYAQKREVRYYALNNQSGT